MPRNFDQQRAQLAQGVGNGNVNKEAFPAISHTKQINNKNKMHSRTQDDYEVNDAEKGAKENAAYEIDAEKKAEPKENGSAETKEQKWVSNYVPYGDYPKGNVVYVKEVRY